ncbi:MAG: hypothetical protein ACKONH_07615 [Planctomycetia bacterium]
MKRRTWERLAEPLAAACAAADFDFARAFPARPGADDAAPPPDDTSDAADDSDAAAPSGAAGGR